MWEKAPHRFLNLLCLSLLCFRQNIVNEIFVSPGQDFESKDVFSCWNVDMEWPELFPQFAMRNENISLHDRLSQKIEPIVAELPLSCNG